MAEQQTAKVRLLRGIAACLLRGLLGLPFVAGAAVGLVVALPVWVFRRAAGYTLFRSEKYGLLPPPKAPKSDADLQAWNPYKK